MAGTITARVFRGEESVTIVFQPVDYQHLEFKSYQLVHLENNTIITAKPIFAKIDFETGVFQLVWDKNPGETRLEVSYEYRCSDDSKI